VKLYLVVDKGIAKAVFLKRRAAIEEASDQMMNMVEIDADVAVVSFSIENGIVDLSLFGSIGDKALTGKQRE
jgi:hypothetical protein